MKTLDVVGKLYDIDISTSARSWSVYLDLAYDLHSMLPSAVVL